jgi:hypothetical protein
MSVFYDLASLVLVPSGYKSGKVYSQKPQTTDGQLAFTRASTATRVNASGLIESVATGVPRLDYLNSTCPKLLLEPQRSNLVTYSQEFDNAAWAKTNVSVTANSAASPDGTTNAEKLVDTATLSGHFVQQTISITGVHTFSVFAKAAERSVITLQVQEVSTPANFALIYYNVSTGQLEAGEFSTSLSAGKIEAMGNGWYKCIITYTPITAGNHNVRVFVAKNVSGNKVDYVGNGTDGVLIYGCQLEAGAYATSYIPTTTAAVTRVADLTSKTGITSLIGQTEGTLFVETTYNGAVNTGLFNRLITISNGLDNNLITVSKNASTTELYLYAQTAAGVQVNSNAIANTNLVGTHKIALAYKANDYVLYVDGVQRFTDTSAEVPACSQLNIGNIPFFAGGDELGGGVNQALLFKTRLTNAQLAELTAL